MCIFEFFEKKKYGSAVSLDRIFSYLVPNALHVIPGKLILGKRNQYTKEEFKSFFFLLQKKSLSIDQYIPKENFFSLEEAKSRTWKQKILLK